MHEGIARKLWREWRDGNVRIQTRCGKVLGVSGKSIVHEVGTINANGEERTVRKAVVIVRSAVHRKEV